VKKATGRTFQWRWGPSKDACKSLIYNESRFSKTHLFPDLFPGEALDTPFLGCFPISRPAPLLRLRASIESLIKVAPSGISRWPGLHGTPRGPGRLSGSPSLSLLGIGRCVRQSFRLLAQQPVQLHDQPPHGDGMRAAVALPAALVVPCQAALDLHQVAIQTSPALVADEHGKSAPALFFCTFRERRDTGRFPALPT
jgi:hypothetical protein